MHTLANCIWVTPKEIQTPEAHAVIFVHGRGDDTNKMSQLAESIIPKESAYLAFPRATNHTWYPNRFIADWQENEPYLSNALSLLNELVAHYNQLGIPAERIHWVGFSQGSCLLLDYLARNAKRYGGVFALSGGLIGPHIDASLYQGDFQQTPIFMGCSDIDSHIPLARLYASNEQLIAMNARVTLRIYEGEGHLINEDELQTMKQFFNATLSSL
jgi:phospholipase/carboxylesterase